MGFLPADIQPPNLWVRPSPLFAASLKEFLYDYFSYQRYLIYIHRYLLLLEYYNYLDYENYFLPAYPLTQKIYEIVNAYYIPWTSRKNEAM
jgi:hypothetical protein